METQTNAQSEADFTYKLNAAGTGVVITGYKGTAARVIIPAAIEGFPVREIGPYAFSVVDNGSELMSFHAKPDDDTSASKDTGVYTITYSRSRLINNFHADKISYKLTSVVIPRGVTRIGERAFAETFYAGYDGTDKVEISHSLRSVTIPDTVAEIGENAFQGCEKLDGLALPTALRTLPSGIFFDCKSLKTIVIPEGVKSIPSGMFSGCAALASVTFPKNLDSIGEYAFHGCTSLSTLVIPDSVKYIGRNAFAHSGLTSFSWPAKLPEISRYAFQDTKLKTLVIPKEIQEIEEGAFGECKELTSVTFPTSFFSGIIKIHAGAFECCTALSTVTISRMAKFPPDYKMGAFSGCSKLNLAAQLELKKHGYAGSF